jgi:ketosteroid isomerase-like protein
MDTSDDRLGEKTMNTFSLINAGLVALIDDWLALWNSYDLSRVASIFSPDVTYFSSDKEEVVRGLSGVLEHHKGYGFVPGGKKSGNTLSAKDVAMAFLDERTSLLTGLWSFERAIDPSKNQHGLFTIIVRKTEAGWRMIHLHFSTYKTK